MSELNSQYYNEAELFRKAVNDPKAKRKLKKEMKELTGTIADKYLREGVSREELIIIGMSSFDHAFDYYSQHLKKADESGEDLYKFSTYFVWWAKNSIERYLKEK